MDISTNFCNVSLGNPFVLASGILGTSFEILERAIKAGAAAVTVKSIGPAEREGNSNPTVVGFEHGMLNAVGLPSPGIDAMHDELMQLKESGYCWIAAIYGSSVTDYASLTKKIVKYKPSIIEVNISCPNKKDGMVFGVDAKLTHSLVSAVKESAAKIPVMPKLTPNCTDIQEIARACESAGADAISAINTVKGMLINIEAKKPVLSYRYGGISGPAIKPVAIRCVYEIYEAVRLPILGMGGVVNARDAVELMMAGASAVGIGTAVHYRGIGVFAQLCDELKEWMKKNNYSSVSQLVGAAHQ